MNSNQDNTTTVVAGGGISHRVVTPARVPSRQQRRKFYVRISTSPVAYYNAAIEKRTSSVKRKKDAEDITAAEVEKYRNWYKDEENIEQIWKNLYVPDSLGSDKSPPFRNLDDLCMLDTQVEQYLNKKNKQGGKAYKWNDFQEQHIATCRQLGWETSFGDANLNIKMIKYRFQTINPFNKKKTMMKRSDIPKRKIAFQKNRPDLFSV